MLKLGRCKKKKEIGQFLFKKSQFPAKHGMKSTHKKIPGLFPWIGSDFKHPNMQMEPLKIGVFQPVSTWLQPVSTYLPLLDPAEDCLTVEWFMYQAASHFIWLYLCALKHINTIYVAAFFLTCPCNVWFLFPCRGTMMDMAGSMMMKVMKSMMTATTVNQRGTTNAHIDKQ